MAEKSRPAAVSTDLEQELVPLHVAAQLAYFELTSPLRQVTSPEDLVEMLHFVAIALSTAAPIERLDGRRLGDDEIRDALYAPLGRPIARPTLEGLAIRRAHLKRALTTLREARIAFGRSNG